MTTTERVDLPLSASDPAATRVRSVLERLGEEAWLRIHLATLAAGGVVLAFLNRTQWFFFDEWEFILERGKHPSLGLFTPHNEHWSTAPALIYKALLYTVGLDEYWPYVAVLVLLHLALAHFLWRASLRAGAHPAIATGIAAIFAVLGAGGENLTWAFQMGFVGSVAFGWLAVLLHDHDGPFGRRDLYGWAALITGLTFSGPAVSFIGVTTLLAALRRRPRRDVLLVGAGPLAVYVLWYLVAGRHNHGQLSQGLNNPWTMFDWTWAGVTGTAQEVLGIADSGTLVILAMLAWWLRHPGAAAGRSSIALAGYVGAFGFYFMTGLARADAGAGFATITRYTYVAAALLAPAAALLLTRVTAATDGVRLAVVGLCAAVAFHNVDLLRSQVRTDTARERQVLRRLAAYDDFMDGDPRILPGQGLYIPHSAVEMTSELLPRLADYDWEPDVELSSSEKLHPQAMFQLGIRPAAGELGSVSLSAEDATVTTTSTEGCVRVRPTVDDDELAEVVLDGGDTGWRVRIVAAGPSIVEAALRADDGGTARRALALAGGKPEDLVSYLENRPVYLALGEDQHVTICGVETRER